MKAVLIAAVLLRAGFAHETLPVFLADNHAETFGWVTRTFDLDRPHVLVLVDAHSDASALERSEEVREQVRRVPSEAARIDLVEQWRTNGRLQPFNWIEPLMPRPFSEVIWINGKSGDEAERATLAGRQLDGRLEIEPRGAGEMKGRWSALSVADFEKLELGERKVILSIDLDTFAGMAEKEREDLFERIWARAMDFPGLVGVSFSVSRPWLTDNDEADALVAMALKAVVHTRGTTLEIDVAMDDRVDLSLKADEFEGGQVPRWNFSESSPAVEGWIRMINVFGMRRCRLVNHRGEPVFPILGSEISYPEIRPAEGEVSIDGVWRFQKGAVTALSVLSNGMSATGRVRWHRLDASRVAYDLWPETRLGKGFANSPGRWVYEKTMGEPMVTSDLQLAMDREMVGRSRWFAEVETSEGWIPTQVCELRVADGDGFRGALSECFGMPYVFGISTVDDENGSGVNSGWGSDCANFLVYAWLRNGVRMPWGDPGMLRKKLVTLAESQSVGDGFSITDEKIEKGLVVDFGNHVAAVWEDREPLGRLDAGDRMIHHLGGLPVIVRLGELAADRPKFSIRALPMDKHSCRVRMAGDVVLAGNDLVVVEGFEKGDGDLFVANLECVFSSREPETNPRYDFRASLENLDRLKDAGVDVVSMANNHALDAGRDGLLESMKRVRESGVAVVGVGKDVFEACEPWLTTKGGVKLAVFGVSGFRDGSATDEDAGTASLQVASGVLSVEMQQAARDGRRIVVIVHWGDEYREEVSGEQLYWARWLIEQGADLIVGAGPHVVQREEMHGGAKVIYSLGNAVYPRNLKGADSGLVRELVLGE